jgi:hypothetical protein
MLHFTGTRTPGGLTLVLGFLAATVGCEQPGPLARLTSEQEMYLHFHSRGCFHSIDSMLVFSRRASGEMWVKIERQRGAGAASIPQRLLRDVDVSEVDRQLRYAKAARGTDCTTRQEFEIAIRDHGVEISREHFVDESCDAPEPLAGGVTLYELARE